MRRVDALQATELRATRKRLGLKQAEAAAIFGGGINAFSKVRARHSPTRQIDRAAVEAAGSTSGAFGGGSAGGLNKAVGSRIRPTATQFVQCVHEAPRVR